MKKWIALTVATCCIAVAFAVLPPTVSGTTIETIAPRADQPLFPSFLDLAPAPACAIDGAPILLLPGGGYECPFGVPYCFRASQCAAYCAGGDAVCEFGCCACAS